MTVAVLWVKPGSHYRTLSGVECFDRERDARTFGGGMPVVAHPPCAQWGRLRMLAMKAVQSCPDAADEHSGALPAAFRVESAASRRFAAAGRGFPGVRQNLPVHHKPDVNQTEFPSHSTENVLEALNTFAKHGQLDFPPPKS